MNFLKLKFGLLSLLIVFAVSIFLTSCEKDGVNQIQELPQSQEELLQSHEINIQNVEKERSVLAKHLSIMIAEQPELNDVLKEMIDEEVEKGYYEKEIFFNIKKDETSNLLNGNTLNSRLSSSHNKEIRNAIDYLSKNDPGLAILMVNPSKSTEFNTRVYIDNGLDDSNQNSMIEYYESGVKGTHPISEVPNTMTYIVRQSEAYVPKTELKKSGSSTTTVLGTINGQDIHAFGYSNKKIEQESGIISSEKSLESSNENAKMGSQCARDGFNGMEKIYSMKAYGWGDYWGNTAEYKVEVIFANTGVLGRVTKYIYGIKGDLPNTDQFINQNTFQWDSNGHNVCKYIWHEMDYWGSTISVSVGLPNKAGNVTYTYRAEDDKCGEYLVYYCDDIVNAGGGGGIYSGDLISFTLGKSGSAIGPTPDMQFTDVTFEAFDACPDGSGKRLFMCNESNGNRNLIADRCFWNNYSVGVYEKFTIFMKYDKTFGIRGSNGKFARVHDNTNVRCDGNDLNDGRARFEFVDQGNGRKAIRSTWNSKYMASEGIYAVTQGVEIRCNRDTPYGDWEKWVVRKSDGSTNF